MESKLLQILQGYEGALNGPGKPFGVSVHRHPERPLSEDDLPSMVLYDAPVLGGVADRSELVRLGSTPRNQRHTLNLRVELRAQLDGSMPPDEVLDPMYVWAEEAIVGAGTLGGLLAQSAIRVSSSGLVLIPDARNVAARAVDYQAVYETRRGDATQ